MICTVPVEILNEIVSFLDFTGIMNLLFTSKYIMNTTQDLITCINVDIAHKKKTNTHLSLQQRLNFNDMAINFCNRLKKFRNIKELRIINLYFVQDDIGMYHLFNTIASFINLRKLSILLDYNITPNSTAIIHNLKQFKSLNKLEKIEIPNIIMDNFPFNYFDCANLLTNNVFKSLQNIKHFNMCFKNKIHHYYLDNLNHKTLETLYITSKHCNIFNEHYTYYDNTLSTYLIKKTIMFDKLKTVNLNIDISDVKTFLYILDSTTRDSIECLTIDFKKRKNTYFGSLFEKINELRGLKQLSLLNLLPFGTQSPLCELNNKLEHVSINFVRKTDPKMTDIEDRIEIIKNLTKLEKLKTLTLDLCRSAVCIGNVNYLLPNCESLIISNINTFTYLSIFLELALTTSSIKNVFIHKVTTFGRNRKKILDNESNYKKFLKIFNGFRQQHKSLIIHNKYIGNLLSKKVNNYKEKIAELNNILL